MARPVIAAILLGYCLCAALGQSPPEPKQGPVQAEFLAHINVRHLANGATIFARVTLDWSGPDCVLRQGSILEAKVEIAQPRKVRGESKLALSFNRAQCNGTEMRPLDLMLAAVADAPADWVNAPDSQFSMPMSFSNPHGNGLPGFGAAGIGDQYISHLELRGIIHRFPMRPDLQPGAILGLKGMKLDLGIGPNHSSILSTRRGDVSLGAFTQILLVPTSVALRPSTQFLSKRGEETTDTAAPASPPALPVAPANDLDVCAPPGCAVDLPVTTRELEGHSSTSIALRPLGYIHRSNKVLDDFDNEEALAWLASDEVLLTFNPHRLIRRSGTSPASAPMRIVRAVLLNAQSRKILRAVDWEITDSRRYLWPLDGGRVLAHIGNELRVYGSGLQMERTIPLAGALAFVQIAPNGALAAVGTLRERHSPQLHDSLRQETGREPEEDVEVEILDKDFNVIARASTVSGLLPPTLLNEGQVKLLAQPNMRYRLAMSTWDNKSTTLALFDSRCTPELSSMAPDLLFLLTCNVMDTSLEYRVLSADGKMLLRGKAAPRQVGHEALGNHQNPTFAVKVVHANREFSPGAAFKGSELDSEEIRIYNAQNGKRLLSVHLDDPPTSRGTYALSPDGSQIAALSGTEIRFFSVPVD
jgi:hypothetical protein